jgi:dTDP-4-dehydrorhamnose 3,5-epimerase
MEIIKPPIDGLLVINPKIFGDDRGYFFESWNEESFVKNGLDLDFV